MLDCLPDGKSKGCGGGGHTCLGCLKLYPPRMKGTSAENTCRRKAASLQDCMRCKTARHPRSMLKLTPEAACLATCRKRPRQGWHPPWLRPALGLGRATPP